MINKHRKSIYPEYKHIQLLKACILEGESAIEAWKNWDRITDINDIDNASMRLLPSLYLTLLVFPRTTAVLTLATFTL